MRTEIVVCSLYIRGKQKTFFRDVGKYEYTEVFAHNETSAAQRKIGIPLVTYLDGDNQQDNQSCDDKNAVVNRLHYSDSGKARQSVYAFKRKSTDCRIKHVEYCGHARLDIVKRNGQRRIAQNDSQTYGERH